MENFKVVVNRSNDEHAEMLFHSDTFLGDEFSDEMYHWKYIKREKKNGKWRYYYEPKDNQLQVLKTKAVVAQMNLDRDAKIHRQKLYESDMHNAQANIKNNPDGPKNVEHWYKNVATEDRFKEAYREGEWLRRDARDTQSAYNRHKDTVRGKIDAYMLKYGKTIVSKLNKNSDKVHKGKEAVKKFIKKHSFIRWGKGN